MEINELLNSLGIDLTNPEARKGAMEAIDAILSSRIDLSGLGGGGGGGSFPGKPTEPVEIEVDPDLLQPSVKHKPPVSQDDIDIEDEEKLLDKVKHNKPEDPEEPGNEPEEPGNEPEEPGKEPEEPGNEPEEPSNPSKPKEPGEKPDEPGGEPGEPKEPEDNPVVPGKTLEEPEEPPEEGYLDDEIKQATKGGDADKKTDSRKIKRERTLRAAKEALQRAQEKKAPKALISELESAIAALEELVEAVSKNIADLSDEEFNVMINRVFDAIDALGTGDLTYSTEEDRQAKVKEIKADMSSSKTQAELSAEDAAVIRTETQAVKAREKEADKYKTKSRKSFQGFQAFMDSLQRGIALQVSYEEERDDTWSALSRRNSGAGVLRQGQKINELPNKKVPIIDFYFDQSGSWDETDLEVGNQAVEALAQMQEDGKIKINIYYFANHVHEKAEDARAEGGTRAWNDIVKNIVTTEATNVVIMTDDDMESWWSGDKALKHTVSGFVWYLWRNGENAPRLPRDLQGRGGTMQYAC
jgi:hypothetical protein